MMMTKNGATTLQITIPSYCEVKVYRSLCIELHGFIGRILHLLLDIESARPNCALAMQALCSLHFTLDKAKSVIKHCSESSQLYLISAILRDLRDTEFSLEFAEEEARKVVLSMFEKNFPDSVSMENAELEAIQIATLRLNIKSSSHLLVEKATLKRQLKNVNGTNQKEKELLEYLLYLLIKYEKLICQVQNGSQTSP
ncbi:U-box domain-containing protein 45-like isoform X2 [Lotus japonicus]|uniref:U-box domain-containing protein 45-like isoform X2 n=1 Tax=Lotus japonicus TaxID=34305 RepID=UPI002584F7A5|nr:U-box domain-containing protein 45-like isoform X2 [Lotus japonicus]